MVDPVLTNVPENPNAPAPVFTRPVLEALLMGKRTSVLTPAATLRLGLGNTHANDPVLPGTSAASKTKLVYGYSVGAGIDVMLVGGLFMRAEYEYRRVTSDVESNINTVRAGLGYKF